MILKYLKRYSFFFITLVLMVLVNILNRQMGQVAVEKTLYSFREMILIIPPVFILLGLLDVWVPRETVVKHLGEKSGLKGALLSIFLGTAAAGPLYAAFPIAAVFMRKGVRFFNILLFLGAWSTTKIPMFLFELSALGPRFAFTRLTASLLGIFVIAIIISKLLSRDDVAKIYANAEKMTS